MKQFWMMVAIASVMFVVISCTQVTLKPSSVLTKTSNTPDIEYLNEESYRNNPLYQSVVQIINANVKAQNEKNKEAYLRTYSSDFPLGQQHAETAYDYLINDIHETVFKISKPVFNPNTYDPKELQVIIVRTVTDDDHKQMLEKTSAYIFKNLNGKWQLVFID